MIISVSIERRILLAGSLTVRCEIGRAGACLADDKREGDGRTPIGDWPIRAALLRPDRCQRPPSRLPWRWLRPNDGWCDDPTDPAYNRPVRLPYPASAEQMWREDVAYDGVIVLGHNDTPPRFGAGSAIFLHIATGRPTEGCIAIDAVAMASLLLMVTARDRLAVA